MTDHAAPNAMTPLPLVWPGAVSPSNVYSGWPSYVACTVPSDRLIVPNLPVSVDPDAACGIPSTGGHAMAQAPVQADVVEVSLENQYSVLPFLSASTVPSLVLSVFSS